MEEYIKVLEEIVETYRSCSVNEEGFDMKVDIGFTKKECEALENLIAGYKQLEEENRTLKAQKIAINNKRKELEEELNGFRTGKYITLKVNELYISTSLVKDKMEELNKEIKSCDVTEAIFKIKQQILQELLESEV